jgi:hypothetical protein
VVSAPGWVFVRQCCFPSGDQRLVGALVPIDRLSPSRTSAFGSIIWRTLADGEIKRYILQIDLAERTLFPRKFAVLRSSISISKITSLGGCRARIILRRFVRRSQ